MSTKEIVQDGAHPLPLGLTGDELLDELDAFFSQGSNTDRVRNFIEENDDTFCLVASEEKMNTNTEASLRLYRLFQKYALLVEGIMEDFMATKETQDESLLRSLALAIRDEWTSPNTAYRYVCTSYIAASLDYQDFLELVEDLYNMTQYQMSIDEEEDVDGTGA